jgi:hypothetical protein
LGCVEVSLVSLFQIHGLRGNQVCTARALPLLSPGTTGGGVDAFSRMGGIPEIVMQWDRHNFTEVSSRERFRNETGWFVVMESIPASRRFHLRG